MKIILQAMTAAIAIAAMLMISMLAEEDTFVIRLVIATIAALVVVGVEYKSKAT